jgi:hypothetical protein
LILPMLGIRLFRDSGNFPTLSSTDLDTTTREGDSIRSMDEASRQAIQDNLDLILPLVYIARINNNFAPSEKLAISDFVRSLSDKALDTFVIKEELSALECSARQFHASIAEIRETGKASAVLDVATSMVMAKKVPDPIEVGALEKLKTTLLS